MADVLLDALIDSLKILAVVAVCTYLIAFLEPLLSKKIRLKGKLAPLLGVSISLLPQCGFSVVAADLYQKRHITLGTLIGVFIATSDDALPVFLSFPDKALHILPILALKFVLGLFFCYLIDFIYSKNKKAVSHHVRHCAEEYRIRLMHCKSAELVPSSAAIESCKCEDCTNSECAHNHAHSEDHEHSHEEKPSKTGILSDYSEKYTKKRQSAQTVRRLAVSPLLHSIEIFIYVLAVNIIFGIVLYYVGEDKIVSFLSANKYIAPLLSVFIGAIPNCVSSIVLSELYIFGGLGFGATLGGLCMNAGLGFMVLFKNTKHIKRNLIVLLIMFLISVFVAYIFSLIFSFGTLKF